MSYPLEEGKPFPVRRRAHAVHADARPVCKLFRFFKRFPRTLLKPHFPKIAGAAENGCRLLYRIDQSSIRKPTNIVDSLHF